MRLSRYLQSSVSKVGLFNGETRPCIVYNIESKVVPYVQGWRWQHGLMRSSKVSVKKVISPSLPRLVCVGFWSNRAIDAQRAEAPHPDSLIVLEHSSTYTLGRGSKLSHVNFDPHAADCPHEIHRIERGGEVTWHGPGQVVCYPIFDLTHHKKDLRWYLRQIEGAIINTLKEFDISAERDEAGTGVWVGERKIAAMGLSVSRWITMHGLSLNVSPDMSSFGHIVPCGIEHRGVTSIAMELAKRGETGVETKMVRDLLIKSIAQEFGLSVDFAPSEPSTDSDPDWQLDDSEWLAKHSRKL